MHIQVFFVIFIMFIDVNIVPHTTRPARPGEEHGKEYYFIDFGKKLGLDNRYIQELRRNEYCYTERRIFGIWRT